MKIKSTETPTFKAMVNHVKTTIESRTIGSILGKPGVGKSHLGHMFAASDPNCVFIEIGFSRLKSDTQLWRLLHNEVLGRGYHITHRSANSMRRDVEEFLNSCPDLWLWFDEIQRAEPEIILSLLPLNTAFKGSNTPIILSGNREYWTGRGANAFDVDQISSRVRNRVLNIESASKRDFIDIAASNGVEGVDAYDYIEAIHTDTPDLRRLIDLLVQARSILSQGPLKFDVLKLATSQLPGFDVGKGVFKISRTLRNTG